MDRVWNLLGKQKHWGAFSSRWRGPNNVSSCLPQSGSPLLAATLIPNAFDFLIHSGKRMCEAWWLVFCFCKQVCLNLSVLRELSSIPPSPGVSCAPHCFGKSYIPLGSYSKEREEINLLLEISSTERGLDARTYPEIPAFLNVNHPTKVCSKLTNSLTSLLCVVCCAFFFFFFLRYDCFPALEFSCFRGMMWNSKDNAKSLTFSIFCLRPDNISRHYYCIKCVFPFHRNMHLLCMSPVMPQRTKAHLAHPET